MFIMSEQSATIEIAKQRVIANSLKKKAKWNNKNYPNSPKEGRKKDQENKNQMGQIENKQQDDRFKSKYI